jgi:hypothetical protein
MIIRRNSTFTNLPKLFLGNRGRCCSVSHSSGFIVAPIGPGSLVNGSRWIANDRAAGVTASGPARRCDTVNAPQLTSGTLLAPAANDNTTPPNSGKSTKRPMNPKASFVILAAEINRIRQRTERAETLSGILAAQISRQRSELAALQEDVDQAIKTLEQSEPQRAP